MKGALKPLTFITFSTATRSAEHSAHEPARAPKAKRRYKHKTENAKNM